MKKRYFQFRELPITYIHADPDHPRQHLGAHAGDDLFMTSVKKSGIQQPIMIRQIHTNTYRIIDGHRRYFAAKHFGFKILPCCVYGQLTRNEVERIRFELQHQRRTWTPLERLDVLRRIKAGYGFKTNFELAQYIGCPEQIICNELLHA